MKNDIHLLLMAFHYYKLYVSRQTRSLYLLSHSKVVLFRRTLNVKSKNGKIYSNYKMTLPSFVIIYIYKVILIDGYVRTLLISAYIYYSRFFTAINENLHWKKMLDIYYYECKITLADIYCNTVVVTFLRGTL